MYTNPLTQKLYVAFNEFRNLMPAYRHTKLREIESMCNEIRSQYAHDSYVSETLVDILESCRQMARKRQPKNYNESTAVSFVLGDISTIDSQVQSDED